MGSYVFLRSFLVLAFGCHALAGCQPTPNSQVKTLFGEHKYRILEESQVQSNLEKSVGALYTTTWDDETQRSYTQKFCSALQIAPHFILTNAHCMKKKDADNFVDFFFSKDSIALDGEGARFIVDDVFDEIYLSFQGKVRADATQNSQLQPNLTVRHVAADLDYAILEINDAAMDPIFTSIQDAPILEDAREVNLLSYPNAMPLTLSYDCSLKTSDAAEVKHSCASAGGSSGGILFDPTSQAPLALHKQGVFYNSAEFYKKNHRSETPVEMAQHECEEKYHLDVNSDKFRACVETRSQKFLFNRAVPLAKVVESLRSTQADLYSEIFGHG